MQTTTPEIRVSTHYRQDRPCLPCGTATANEDQYCAECGAKVYGLADQVLAWHPNVNLRSLEERPSGAALAKQVRKLLKPFAGVKVHTERGYHVNVTIPTPNFWDLGNGEYARSIHDAPYQNHYHHLLYREAEMHLQRQLRFLFSGTAGIRDDGPGADYPYLSLPILTVNGW